MIPLAEAQAVTRDGLEPLPVLDVDLADALGLVLAADLRSTATVPPFANSAMDGFAVRSADTAGSDGLRVVDTVHAGRTPLRPLGVGEAIRIMTGAPVPEGADAVVMVERCTVTGGPDGGEFLFYDGRALPGDNIRPAGDDITDGQLLLAASTELDPAAIAVCATVGIGVVPVHRRPRCAVFSTGDELVSGTARLRPGQIRDSNRPALLAALTASGFDTVDGGVVADDEDAIAVALRTAVETADAVVTSGGVSMGDADLLKVVLERLGPMRWMQVAIRPAKPLAFGTIERGDATSVPVFGLPGNPVSSMVSFELFARPALRRMAGHPPQRLDRPKVTAVLSDDLVRAADGKIHFVRVSLTRDAHHGLRAASAGAQGSHNTLAMARADGLVVLADGNGARAGDVVEVIPLR